MLLKIKKNKILSYYVNYSQIYITIKKNKKKVCVSEIPLYIIKNTKINRYSNNITNVEELIHYFLNDIEKNEFYKNKNIFFIKFILLGEN